MKHVLRGSAAIATAILLMPQLAVAQPKTKPPKNPRWAVSFSVTPSWKIAPFIQNALSDDDETVNFEGSELTIGFGRGSRRGGDWGVNFVRKPFKDGLITEKSQTQCFPGPPPNNTQLCNTSHETNVARGMMLTGFEVHWFIAVARIKDRIQLGVNLAGGIANVKGTIHKVEEGSQWQFVPSPGGQGTNVLTPFHNEEDNPASEELMKKFPLIKVEIEGGVILTPALKVQIAGGLNFPSTNGVRVLFLYLIGGK